MSKYTTLLRWIVEESESHFTAKPSNSMYHQATYETIGLDTYPIFRADYRNFLNDKIINHYYFWEIGLETRALFQWFMRVKMNEIMPYYNELYKSLDFITDPLTDWGRIYGSSIITEHSEDWQNKTNSDSSSTGSNSDRNVYQDTPMSMLRTEPSEVEQLKYATNVTFDKGTQTSTNSTDSIASGDRKRHEDKSHVGKDTGWNQPQASLLKEYRETLLNIDMLVIKDLESLFMGLW